MDKVEKLIQQHKKMLLQADPNHESMRLPASNIFGNKLALSPSELAQHLGISSRTVDRMLKRGEIQYKKIGRRVVIPVNAIETWLNKKD